MNVFDVEYSSMNTSKFVLLSEWRGEFDPLPTTICQFIFYSTSANEGSQRSYVTQQIDLKNSGYPHRNEYFHRVSSRSRRFPKRKTIYDEISFSNRFSYFYNRHGIQNYEPMRRNDSMYHPKKVQPAHTRYPVAFRLLPDSSTSTFSHFIHILWRPHNCDHN